MMLSLNNKRILSTAILLTLSCVSLTCYAEDQATLVAENASSLADKSWLPKRLLLHAFGTIGASYHDEEGLTYRRNIEQKDTVEADKLDFASDSLLGGQATYLFNDTFSATTQLVSRNDAWGKWKPEFISAFIKYAPTDALQFRLGRMTTDSNLGAESRYAGYAYTNIRPSPEVFGLLAAYDRFDGADMHYRQKIGTGIGGIRFNLGKIAGERYLAGESAYLKDNMTYGVITNWQTDHLELRASAAFIDVKNFKGYQLLADNLALVPLPSPQQRAQEITNMSDHKVTVISCSAEYEINQWKFQAIYGDAKTTSFPTYKGENASLMVAYRFGGFTPYVMAAHSRFKPVSRALILPPIAQLQPLAEAYSITSNLLRINQSTLSAGVRYDFNEHYDVKFQIDKINADQTPLILSSRSAGSNQDLTLMTIALDFFF